MDEALKIYRKLNEVGIPDIFNDEGEQAFTPDQMIWFGQQCIGQLQKEIEKLTTIKDRILQQAQGWAMEAKTQRSTVNEVGSLLEGVPDWGKIAKGVEEKLAKLENLEKENAELRDERKQDLINFCQHIMDYQNESHTTIGLTDDREAEEFVNIHLNPPGTGNRK